MNLNQSVYCNNMDLKNGGKATNSVKQLSKDPMVPWKRLVDLNLEFISKSGVQFSSQTIIPFSDNSTIKQHKLDTEGETTYGATRYKMVSAPEDIIGDNQKLPICTHNDSDDGNLHEIIKDSQKADHACTEGKFGKNDELSSEKSIHHSVRSKSDLDTTDNIDMELCHCDPKTNEPTRCQMDSSVDSSIDIVSDHDSRQEDIGMDVHRNISITHKKLANNDYSKLSDSGFATREDVTLKTLACTETDVDYDSDWDKSEVNTRELEPKEKKGYKMHDKVFDNESKLCFHKLDVIRKRTHEMYNAKRFQEITQECVPALTLLHYKEHYKPKMNKIDVMIKDKDKSIKKSTRRKRLKNNNDSFKKHLSSHSIDPPENAQFCENVKHSSLNSQSSHCIVSKKRPKDNRKKAAKGLDSNVSPELPIHSHMTDSGTRKSETHLCYQIHEQAGDFKTEDMNGITIENTYQNVHVIKHSDYDFQHFDDQSSLNSHTHSEVCDQNNVNHKQKCDFQTSKHHKRLTRNPLAPWKRLVDVNIESIGIKRAVSFHNSIIDLTGKSIANGRKSTIKKSKHVQVIESHSNYEALKTIDAAILNEPGDSEQTNFNIDKLTLVDVVNNYQHPKNVENNDDCVIIDDLQFISLENAINSYDARNILPKVKDSPLLKENNIVSHICKTYDKHLADKSLNQTIDNADKITCSRTQLESDCDNIMSIHADFHLVEDEKGPMLQTYPLQASNYVEGKVIDTLYHCTPRLTTSSNVFNGLVHNDTETSSYSEKNKINTCDMVCNDNILLAVTIKPPTNSIKLLPSDDLNSDYFLNTFSDSKCECFNYVCNNSHSKRSDRVKHLHLTRKQCEKNPNNITENRSKHFSSREDTTTQLTKKDKISSLSSKSIMDFKMNERSDSIKIGFFRLTDYIHKITNSLSLTFRREKEGKTPNDYLESGENVQNSDQSAGSIIGSSNKRNNYNENENIFFLQENSKEKRVYNPNGNVEKLYSSKQRKKHYKKSQNKRTQYRHGHTYSCDGRLQKKPVADISAHSLNELNSSHHLAEATREIDTKPQDQFLRKANQVNQTKEVCSKGENFTSLPASYPCSSLGGNVQNYAEENQSHHEDSVNTLKTTRVRFNKLAYLDVITSTKHATNEEELSDFFKGNTNGPEYSHQQSTNSSKTTSLAELNGAPIIEPKHATIHAETSPSKLSLLIQTLPALARAGHDMLIVDKRENHNAKVTRRTDKSTEYHNDLDGSDVKIHMLTSSLGCLLEMLQQRGKINEAFVATVDGQVLAHTSGLYLTAGDITLIVCCMTSSYRGIAKITLLNIDYHCFKVDQNSSLIGRSQNSLFVARLGRESLVVGFASPSTSGSCIREIEELSVALSQRGL